MTHPSRLPSWCDVLVLGGAVATRWRVSEGEAVGGVTNRVSQCELSGEDIPDFVVAAKVMILVRTVLTLYSSPRVM